MPSRKWARWDVPHPERPRVLARRSDQYRHEFEADVFLTQLPTPPRLAGPGYGPCVRGEQLTTRSLVSIWNPRKSLNFYAVKLPRPSAVRLVRRTRPMTAIVDLPGFEVIPPASPILTATLLLPKHYPTRLILTDYRGVDPSTFDPLRWRSMNPTTTLPGEVDNSFLRKNAAGWRRGNVWYDPSGSNQSSDDAVGPTFEAQYERWTGGAVEVRNFVYYLSAPALTGPLLDEGEEATVEFFPTITLTTYTAESVRAYEDQYWDNEEIEYDHSIDFGPFASTRLVDGEVPDDAVDALRKIAVRDERDYF